MTGPERVTPSQLSADLIPEQPPPSPKIVNIWTEISTYRAELAHNSDPADPTSDCSGTASITFQLKPPTERKGFGTKQTYCQECKQPVEISIAALALELGLI